MSNLDGSLMKLEAALSAAIRDAENSQVTPEQLQRFLFVIDRTSHFILKLSQRVGKASPKTKGLDKEIMREKPLSSVLHKKGPKQK